MSKQYCKVGASHSPSSGNEGLHLLENQYQFFLRKAEEAVQNQNELKDFFELKAQKIKRLLQDWS
jgi:hypothetical protein